MKRKPPHTPTTTIRPPAAEPPASLLRRWYAGAAVTAVNHLPRGLCYGIGTGAAPLASWWMEQHL